MGLRNRVCELEESIPSNESVSISRECAEFSYKAVQLINFQFSIGKTESAQKHEMELKAVVDGYSCSSMCCPEGDCPWAEFVCKDCGGMVDEFGCCGKCRTGGSK